MLSHGVVGILVDKAVLQSHSVIGGSHVAQHGAVEESGCDEAHVAQHDQHQPRLHQYLPEVTHTQATWEGQPHQGHGWDLFRWQRRKQAPAGVMDIRI